MLSDLGPYAKQCKGRHAFQQSTEHACPTFSRVHVAVFRVDSNRPLVGDENEIIAEFSFFSPLAPKMLSLLFSPTATSSPADIEIFLQSFSIPFTVGNVASIHAARNLRASTSRLQSDRLCTKERRVARRREGDKCFFSGFFLGCRMFQGPIIFGYRIRHARLQWSPTAVSRSVDVEEYAYRYTVYIYSTSAR